MFKDYSSYFPKTILLTDRRKQANVAVVGNVQDRK
jgi:hypothetical protein